MSNGCPSSVLPRAARRRIRPMLASKRVTLENLTYASPCRRVDPSSYSRRLRTARKNPTLVKFTFSWPFPYPLLHLLPGGRPGVVRAGPFFLQGSPHDSSHGRFGRGVVRRRGGDGTPGGQRCSGPVPEERPV